MFRPLSMIIIFLFSNRFLSIKIWTRALYSSGDIFPIQAPSHSLVECWKHSFFVTYKPVSFINPDKGSLAVPVMAKASLQLASLETAPGILNKVKNAYTEVKKANNALENKKPEDLQYFIEKIISLLPAGVSITITGKQV